LSSQKNELEVMSGDSVLVIGKDGNLKKLVMPDMNKNTPHTAGTERVLEILKIFDPTANLEILENVDKGRLN